MKGNDMRGTIVRVWDRDVAKTQLLFIDERM